MRTLLISLLSLVVLSPQAEELTIVTWNVRELFTREPDPSRFDDIQAMMEAIEPDLVLLQELTAEAVLLQLKDHLGLNAWDHAITDFSRGPENDRPNYAFEVAILSRAPIATAIEMDPFPDGQDDTSVPEVSYRADSIQQNMKLGIEPVNTARGFLWVHIPQWKLTVINTHMKSSVGRVGADDESNAQKREIIAAEIMRWVEEDTRLFSGTGYAHIVGGDLNIGHSDPLKVGTDLLVDCLENCSDTDGYDDTHAILRGGLVNETCMRNLTQTMTTSTFPEYPGYPIDTIYVICDQADRFTPARKPDDDETFGSDHTPVWTVFSLN